MPFNLYLFPILGGFYIYSRFYLFKYYEQRLEHSKVYLYSIITGVFLFVIAYFLRILLEVRCSSYVNYIYNLFPFHLQYLGTSFFSLVIGIVFTELINFLGGKKLKYFSLNTVVKKVGNELELMSLESMKKYKLLLLTLKNDKIYIGIAKEVLIPSSSPYIRIIPFMSGFRDGYKSIHFTTDYLSVYHKYMENEGIKTIDKIKELETDVIINIDDISTVSYFSFELLKTFKKFGYINTNKNKKKRAPFKRK